MDQINLKSVGKLNKIRLELHPVDPTFQKRPSWKVKEVRMKDSNSKETLRFKFNAWLSTVDEDNDLMKECAASRPGRSVWPRECNTCDLLQEEIPTEIY